MSDYASFEGVRVMRGALTIPSAGLWCADVQLADETTITGAGQLVIGDLTLQGAAYRSPGFAGVRGLRIVGGFGGWWDTLPAKSYAGVGILLSTVLKDLAAETGEKIAVNADATLGNLYVRAQAPATRVLRQLVGESWWVDASGTVQTGARTVTTRITSRYSVEGFELSLGHARVGTETLSDWTPGRTFLAPALDTEQTISTVIVHIEDGGRQRLKVICQ